MWREVTAVLRIAYSNKKDLVGTKMQPSNTITAFNAVMQSSKGLRRPNLSSSKPVTIILIGVTANLLESSGMELIFI